MFVKRERQRERATEREREREREREPKTERDIKRKRKIGNQVFIPVNPGVIGSFAEPLYIIRAVSAARI